jgi:hypothetical protein
MYESQAYPNVMTGFGRRAAAAGLILSVGLSATACGFGKGIPGTTASTEGQSQGEQNALHVSTAQAVKKLGKLSVKGRAPKTGYSRGQFGPGWDSVQGCDTRNAVLRRDLVDLKLDARNCQVVSGTLDDPYTAKRIPFVRGKKTSGDVQIDHVVALSDAWQKGAAQWRPAQREAFANDPLELWAVSGQTNEQKSDSDAATWLPPNRNIRCTYVAKQIIVKEKYNLWVTPAEHDVMSITLAGCPGQDLLVVH